MRGILGNPAGGRDGKSAPGLARHLRRGGVMTSLTLALVLLVVWAYILGSTVAALRFARRPIVTPAERPAVSLLKPLHGSEPGLYDNLSSFLDQDYPEMQVVFGVRHRADTALPIARALIRENPGRDTALVIDPHASGSNLKV